MSKKSSLPTLQDIHGLEIIDFDGGLLSAQEDEDGRLTAKIRIIKAGLSKNNRNYRPSALKKAAKEGIFNGTRMFVDHLEKGKPPTKRGFMEMVSAIESTEFDEATQSLNGNVEFFDENFYKRVKRAQAFAGVSIDSMLRGTVHPQPGGRALEDIHEFAQPRSVDWVVYPAAGGQLLATESEEDDVIDWAAVEAEAGTLSEEDLKSKAPTLWKKFHPETTANQLPAHGNAPESSADKEDLLVRREDVDDIVNQRLTAYQREQKAIQERQATAAELVRQAFSTSGLPEPVRTRIMRGFEGIEEFDEKAVQKSIDEAKEELAALKVGPRISGMGTGTVQQGQESEGNQAPTFSQHASVAAVFDKKPAASGDTSKGEGN